MQALLYHSVPLFWSGTEATSPILAKKAEVICLEVFLDLLNFTGGLPPAKARLKTPGHAGIRKSSHRDDVRPHPV